MKNSKLIAVLTGLSKAQMSRFTTFVGSDYFNKSEPLRLFFQYLKPLHPTFPESLLQKQAFLSAHYPDSPGAAGQLATWMNQLLRLVESFLVIESLSDKSRLLELMKVYGDMKLPGHLKGVQRKLRQSLEQETVFDVDFFLDKLLMDLHILRNSDLEKRDYKPELQQAMDSLDIFYRAQKFFLAGQMLQAEQILKLSYEKRIPENIEAELEKEPFSNVALLQAHFLFHQLILQQNSETYFALKKVLLEGESTFSRDDLYYFYVGMLNFWTRRINLTGSAAAYEAYLGINEYMLQKGWLTIEGYLSPWIYKNLVSAGLRVGKKDWTLAFIEKYKHQLPAEYFHDTYAYARAYYAFHTADLSKAQSLLWNLSPKDVTLNISVRGLLIKVYFESRQEDLLLAYLEATRVYLTRNKLLDETRRKQMLKFVDFTAKLTKIPAFEPDRKKELLRKLPAASAVMHHAWLKAQLIK